MKKSGAEVERLPIKLRRETKPYFVKFYNHLCNYFSHEASHSLTKLFLPIIILYNNVRARKFFSHSSKLQKNSS